MNVKKYVLCCCAVLLGGMHTFAQNSFAIVIDETSYQKARTEVNAYADAINKDGLKAVVIIDKWYNPDSIKQQLINLYAAKTNPLEGAVFIGDIPIPMVRDAQHLTSAFKMDQVRYEWQRSSVPSDRFYDDFDLKFQFLKQDSAQKNYFYYSMLPGSAQKLSPEIYTGRIKPFENEKKYDQLKAYLTKLVKVRQQQEPVDEIFYFAGHGYNSESMMARVDEKISLLEQFPWLKKQKNGIEYMDHNTEDFIKARLQSQLQKPSLKFALLHHHGDVDVEYLSGMPKADAPVPQIEGVKYFLRSKVRTMARQKKDTAAALKYYMDNYNVPETWFKGAFDQKGIEADSIYNAQMDIGIPDILATTPNVRFLILDACYNGSFHKDEYIAGAYIFNKGNTVAVQANTVNALQDKWANEFLGTIGMGIRVGQWSSLVNYLETHLIGDPAFRFKFNQPVSNTLAANKKNPIYWRQQLLTSAYPEMQALALRMLYTLNYPGLSNLLLETFKNNTNGVVRMECLKLLTAYNDNNFIQCLVLACNDSYELVQRQAVYLAGKSGNHQLIAPLVQLIMANNNSDRIRFCLNEAVSLFPQELVLKQFDNVYDNNQFSIAAAPEKEKLRKWIISSTSRWTDDIELALSDTTSDKKKISSIRLLRNYNVHSAVPELCKLAQSSKNDELKITLLEALGWFNASYNKAPIIQACKEILANTGTSPGVKNECTKTLNRLQQPWYR